MTILEQFEHLSKDLNAVENLNITQQTIIEHFNEYYPLVNFYFENGHISEESRKQFKEYYPEEFI